MQYSEKLNGYYQEGYHYYIEIRDDYFSIRNYMKKMIFETKVHYDVNAIEKNEKTPLLIDQNVLSTDYNGDMMSCIKELYYQDGKLHMLHYYTIMGETNYILTKSDKGPFDDIVLRDDVLQKLQGQWLKYKSQESIMIDADCFTLLYDKEELCKMKVCVKQLTNQKLMLVPKDLTEHTLGMYGELTIGENILTGYPLISDMDMPLSVFVKKGYENHVQIPKEADSTPRNTMMVQNYDLTLNEKE